MSDKLLHLFDEIYIVIGTPFLFINQPNSDRRILCLSDLHIGQEDAMLNYTNVREQSSEALVNQIERYALQFNCTHIILVGDIKHNTSNLSEAEMIGLQYLIDVMQKNHFELILVEGNHDLILKYAVSGLYLHKFYELEHLGKALIFAHGHEDFEYSIPSILIMGHEHFSFQFDKSLKLPAFTLLQAEGVDIILLPASSYISSGTRFGKGFISPLLNKMDLKQVQMFPFSKEKIYPLPPTIYRKYQS